MIPNNRKKALLVTVNDQQGITIKARGFNKDPVLVANIMHTLQIALSEITSKDEIVIVYGKETFPYRTKKDLE